MTYLTPNELQFNWALPLPKLMGLQSNGIVTPPGLLIADSIQPPPNPKEYWAFNC